MAAGGMQGTQHSIGSTYANRRCHQEVWINRHLLLVSLVKDTFDGVSLRKWR